MAPKLAKETRTFSSFGLCAAHGAVQTTTIANRATIDLRTLILFICISSRDATTQASVAPSQLVSVTDLIYKNESRRFCLSNQITGVALERIDHGVLPSNDLGRAFRFWSTFMGAKLGFHANLNVRGLNREVPMIVFFTVANHSGFGLALQDFRLSPTPARSQEGVVWGFEVAAEDLSSVAAEAEKQKVRCERFADYPASSPIKESLF